MNKHDTYRASDSTFPFYDYEKNTHPFDFERILIAGSQEFARSNNSDGVTVEQQLEWLKQGYIYGRLINPQILFMPSRDSGVKEVRFVHYDAHWDDSTEHSAIVVYDGFISTSAMRITPSKRVGGSSQYPGHEKPWEDRSDLYFFGLGLKRPRK